MGPICVTEALAPFLPSHPLVKVGGERGIPPVSAAPWGSAGVLVISWAYIALLGSDGLKRATELAILNANYMAKRLSEHFEVLYTGDRGRVAHEFILDLRPLKKATGISDEDVAKRLIDYGIHPPTMYFPLIVEEALMIEPTETESKETLDYFIEVMRTIAQEAKDSPELLHDAPHDTPNTRVDEARAARQPYLSWRRED